MENKGYCIKEEFEMAVEFAKYMLQSAGKVSPMVVGFKGQDRFVIPFMHSDREEKYMLARIIKEKLRELGATAMLFMTEAWVVQLKKPEQGFESITPSEHPDRKECLVISYINKKGNAGTTIPFHRENGEIVLEEPIALTGTSIEDRLWGDTFKEESYDRATRFDNSRR